jgi:hypothetical protein
VIVGYKQALWTSTLIAESRFRIKVSRYSHFQYIILKDRIIYKHIIYWLTPSFKNVWNCSEHAPCKKQQISHLLKNLLSINFMISWVKHCPGTRDFYNYYLGTCISLYLIYRFLCSKWCMLYIEEIGRYLWKRLGELSSTTMLNCLTRVKWQSRSFGYENSSHPSHFWL